MTKEEILARWGEPTKVGPDGHIRLVDYMGSDAAVVQAARVSYGAGTKTVSDDRNLIRYLLRHRHTTPFEMVELKFHVRVPMDTWRQWIRHRTASVNEYSTRYSEAIDSRATTQPDQWRLQSRNNKQGSNGMLADVEKHTADGVTSAGINFAKELTRKEAQLHKLSQDVYKTRLSAGIAREQARKDLPLSTYTEAYWKMDLHNLLGFLRLRLHPHAQQEIREFAQAIADIVKDVCPVVWEAYEDYAQGGRYFTREEMNALRTMLNGAMGSWLDEHGNPDGPVTLDTLLPDKRKEILEAHISTQRERAEFWRKLNE